MATDPPIAYYSVFLAYSGKDQAFAQRLHDDLQDAGIRAWFAPEDLRAGDKIHTSIDRAIRLHDKSLLILSESSVGSDWVAYEVERALERERQEDRLVLLPIRIDDAVMHEKAGWADMLRRQRNFGDFTDWMEEEAYQKALEQLLRTLRAPGPEEEPPLSELATLSITVDPGTAPPEDIADVLSDLSILYRKMGGSGINFSLKGIHIVEEELA